jgi:ribonuclease HI
LKHLSGGIFFLFISLHCFAQPGTSTGELSTPLFKPQEQSFQHKIGDRYVPVKLLQFGDRNDLICINLHSNEVSSVEGARAVLEKLGGTMIKIENQHQRVIRFRLNRVTYSFDPNRMFSRAGIEQTLRENSRHYKPSQGAIMAIEEFARQILSYIPDTAACVVALHNNTEEAYSVRSYQSGGNRQTDAKAVYADSLQDVDDIILTTDSLLYQKMADNRYNSIWQDNEKAKKDGSLSIYFGELNRRYINIETQHGKVTQYSEMLEKLLLVLEELKDISE